VRLAQLQGRYSRRFYRAIDAADREKRAEMRNRTNAAAAAKRIRPQTVVSTKTKAAATAKRTAHPAHTEASPAPKNSGNAQPNQGSSHCPTHPAANTPSASPLRPALLNRR